LPAELACRRECPHTAFLSNPRIAPMSKPLWIVALMASVAVALAPMDVEAKRLGGARSSGMQRSAPPAQQQPNTPPSQATPSPAATPNSPAAAAAPAAATAGAAAAAAPKRSWLGPVAGLAAGLGLAALFSHLGWGGELANFVMLLLLALVGFVVVRWLLRRFAGGGGASARSPLATAAAGAAPRSAAPQWTDAPMQRSQAPAAPTVTIGSALRPPIAVAGVGAGSGAVALPAGFDAEGFERLAKMLFIRMQAANDAADLNDLRQFTTPELFAALRLDLQDRGDAKQHTDVAGVQAQLIDFAEEDGRQIVSVRYTGRVREAEAAPGSEPTPFDEVWHLVQPADGSRPWAIAGIQQSAPAS
jgi:predicted lipid-binding transport protein (Tim44 family)